MSGECDARYRSLLDRYIKLLEDWRELPDWPKRLPIPLLPALEVVRGECPLRADPSLAHLLVGPGARADGLRELRDFTWDVSRLTVLDPFFFDGNPAEASDLAEELARVARFGEGRLKAVHVIRDDRRENRAVKAAILRKAHQSRVRLTQSSTRALHDRVWIADFRRAVVVGTSFNGVGTRAAFILPLPAPDLNAILEFLYRQGLVRRPARRPKS